MSVKETPLQATKRLFGDKQKLVDSVIAALGGLEEQSDDIRERLTAASNKKLLRLAEVSKEIQSKYGDKDKLIAAIAATAGKAKDAPYVAKLGTLSLPKLLDLARAGEKRARKAARRAAS